MRATFTKDDLANAITAVNPAIPSRPDQPILRGIRIHTSGDRATIQAFDRETSITTTTSCETVEEGAALVAGRVLHNITAALPDKPVEVRTNGPLFEIHCGASHFELPTMTIDDYPPLPAQPRAVGEIPGADFHDAIRDAAGAAGDANTLPILSALQLTGNNGRLTLAVTDRFRLVVRHLDWDGEDFQTLIPARSIADTVKTVGEQPVQILSEPGRFGLRTAGTTIVSRILDGSYPPWQKLIPPSCTTAIHINRKELTAAIKRVRMVADTWEKVQIDATSEGLTVAAASSDVGTASELVSCEIQGEPIMTGFNAGYLLDALDGYRGCDKVLLAATQPSRPMIVRPDALIREEEEMALADDEDLTLLMPTKI